MKHKQTEGSQEPPANLHKDQELEARVDAMMDPAIKDDVSDLKIVTEEAGETSVPPVQQDGLPPIDIFHDPKTAPEVPAELAQTIGIGTEKAAVEDKTEPVSVEEVKSEEPQTAPTADEPAQTVEDAQTDAAIDDITRAEADSLLAAEDDAAQESLIEEPKTRWQRITDRLKQWWSHRWVRYLTLGVGLILLVGSILWPTSRYFLLNTAGVRSGASLTVVDGGTGLPLKNVSVRIGDKEVATGSDGVAQFTDIRLGPQPLIVERVAFASTTRNIIIGWGSNPLGEQALRPTGAQYVFMATDFLSGKPVHGAEASNGQASAVADADGKITLTVENPTTDKLEVTIQAKEYRSDVLDVPVTSKSPFAVRMVSAQPLVYVSRQSGNHDVYRVDVDGKNQKLLLADVSGGRTDDQVQLLPSDDGSWAAVVSKRDDTKVDTNGYVLDAITVIETKSGAVRAIDYAPQVRLIDWEGDRLVYAATYAGPSAQTDGRQRLVSYSIEDEARKLLAKADYFRGIIAQKDHVYYVATSPGQPTQFIRMKSDGNDRKVLLNKELWSLVQIDGATLGLESVDGGLTYSMSNEKLTENVRVGSNRYYVEGPSSHSLWIDERDGKEVLLAYDMATGQDTVVATLNGMTAPMRWLSSRTVAVTVRTQDESALYAISLDGGEHYKVADVTATIVSPNGY